VFIAFLLTLVISRVCVILIMTRRMPNLFFHAGGTHVHHLNYGILLLSVTTAVLLFSPFPREKRVRAALGTSPLPSLHHRRRVAGRRAVVLPLPLQIAPPRQRDAHAAPDRDRAEWTEVDEISKFEFRNPKQIRMSKEEQ
jgi:hypothetical protein